MDMRLRLLELLACPICHKPFELVILDGTADEVEAGLLLCQCGMTYPVVDYIPRILLDAWAHYPDFARRYAKEIERYGGQSLAGGLSFDERQEPTRRSFGYQWTVFGEMVEEFRENFLSYIYPLESSFFAGKLGLDAGCGFGRHVYYAAEYGAEIVGMDFSAAIDVARRNTQHLGGVHLVQGDIYHLPFRPAVFDFVYSFGVLHHLPDPEEGFCSLLPVLKSGGAIFIWVYSKARARMNAALERVRAATTRIPHALLLRLCLFPALIDWGLFIQPYKLLRRIPLLGPWAERWTFPRIKLYAKYPFQVCYADWFDRLSAPMRFYYSEEELWGWCERASLKNINIAPTGKYGWRVYGETQGTVPGR
jgi:SAM-dependent methyltransferase